MRVCIIGNSHAAAWKLGWDRLASSFPDITFHIFAAPRGLLKLLQRRRNVLRTSNQVLRRCLMRTGGTDTICPDDYDIICVTGCGMSILHVARLYESWRAEEHRGREGTFRLVSDACFQTAARAVTANAFGFDICNELAGFNHKQVFLAPQPMPSDAILRSSEQNVWQMISDGGDAEAIAALFTRLVKDICPDGVTPRLQSAHTLSGSIFTQDQYSRGSRRLINNERQHPEDDHFHMNDEYGVVQLSELLTEVGARRHPLDPSEKRQVG